MNKYIISIIASIFTLNTLSSQTYCLSITGPIVNQPNYTFEYTISSTEAIDATIKIKPGDGSRGPLIGGSGDNNTPIKGSFTINTLTFTYDAGENDPNSAYGVITKSNSTRIRQVCTSALPIELIHFQAQNTSEGNLLTWQTASEINASHFEIERSDDGKKFGKIGEVKAQGKATNYEYIDKQAQVATVYYRLKNIDLDGTFAYSKIVSISSTQKGMKAKVYPNPFSENVNIEIFTDEKQELIIELLDIFGKKMYASKINNTEGVLNLPVSTKSLPNGTYFLKIFDGKQIIQEKIIKNF